MRLLSLLVPLIMLSACDRGVPMPIPVGSAHSQAIYEHHFSRFANAVIATDSQCNFDLIDGKERDRPEFSLSQDNMRKTIVGWGVFSAKEANVGKRIFLAVSTGAGERWVVATRREARPDVAAFLKNKNLLHSGFSTSVSFDNFPEGDYTLEIIIENNGRYSLCGIEKKISVVKKT